MKKSIILTVFTLALVVSNMAFYFVGSHHIYMAKDVNPKGEESICYPHFYNTEEALRCERQISNCAFEMLHSYWQHYDFDKDEETGEINKHTYFENNIMKSQAYHKCDSLMEGNWEDFFCEW